MGYEKTVSADAGSGFTPHPAGQYALRCVDVVDVGYVDTGQYGVKYKYRIAFWGGEWTEREIDGETVRIPLLVNATFTASLHENSRLRPFLENWRGKPFTQAELDGFDIEKLYGAPAFGQITHKVTEKATYANVVSIMPLPKAMKESAPGFPEGYVRVEDRPDWEGPNPHPDMETSEPQPTPDAPEPEDEHDGLPF